VEQASTTACSSAAGMNSSARWSACIDMTLSGQSSIQAGKLTPLA
jgi:hypothetical protein